MKLLLLSALALPLLATPQAHAALVQRSMLIQACTARDPARLNDCAGYIAGIADSNDSVEQGVCLPKGLSVRLLRMGVTTYLQSHTVSDGAAAPSVLDALKKLYRCSN